MTEGKTSPHIIMKAILSSNDLYVREQSAADFEEIRDGQNPDVTLVCCSDSRVQPHVILHETTNNLFEIENIGNQIEPSEGSVDYGIYHLKTPLLLIVGHSDCGAIKAFMSGYQDEPETIKASLDPLSGAIQSDREWHPFDLCLVENVQRNVDYQVDLALKKYESLLEDGSLTVVGAVYDFRNDFGMGTGRLVFVNINGETDPHKIAELSVFYHVDQNLKKVSIGRFHYAPDKMK